MGFMRVLSAGKMTERMMPPSNDNLNFITDIKGINAKCLEVVTFYPFECAGMKFRGDGYLF